MSGWRDRAADRGRKLMEFDEKTIADEPSGYVGETGPDGTPLGRGRLRFGDGTVYRGSIDWHSQRGIGVWYYPDGSSAGCGFTLCRETPALRLGSSSGKVYVRFLSRFMSEDGASDPEADAVCAELKRRFDAAGVILEYNARALLCDLILTGELPADAAFPPAGSPGVFRIPDALELKDSNVPREQYSKT